jgi:hypothetical protein
MTKSDSTRRRSSGCASAPSSANTSGLTYGSGGQDPETETVRRHRHTPADRPSPMLPGSGREAGGALRRPRSVETSHRQPLSSFGETRRRRGHAALSMRPRGTRGRPGRECRVRGDGRAGRDPRYCLDAARRPRRCDDRSPADRATASGPARSPEGTARTARRRTARGSRPGPASKAWRYSSTSGVDRSSPGDTGGSAARRRSACASTTIRWESAS